MTPEEIAKDLAIQSLGRGVNVFTMAYNSEPTKSSVVGGVAKLLKPSTEPNLMVDTLRADSFTEFTQKLAVEAGLEGSYQGVTASIESKFSNAYTQSVDTKFFRLKNIISGYTFGLETDLTLLRSQLTENFKKALAEKSASDVIKEYGTHVVTAVNIGAYANYSCCLTTSSTLNQQQIDVAIKASYKSVGGSLGGSTALSEEEQNLVKNVQGETSLEVRGGGHAESMNLMQNSPGAWTQWAATVDSHPGFIGYPQEDSLIPIWKLADTPQKREELELACKQEAAQNCLVHIFSTSYSASSRLDARVVVPNNYKLLSGGAIVTWNGPGMLLTASFPESDNTWRALAKDHINGDSGSMTVYALGLYDPNDLWEVRRFENTGDTASHPVAGIKVSGEFVMVGGGAKVNWTGEGNLLTASFPYDAEAWRAESKDQIKSDPATITVYTLGLRSKVQGIVIKQNIAPSTSQNASWTSAAVSPERGFVMVGGGARVNYTGAGNLLTASYPSDSSTWLAKSKDQINSDSATITAYAVGIKVSVNG